jgi:thymidylate synthase
MIKADIYYREFKRILKENNIDKNPRPKYKDGTDAHCLFITQIFEEYDVSKGEFPLHFEILPLKPESTKSYGYTKTKTLN